MSNESEKKEENPLEKYIILIIVLIMIIIGFYTLWDKYSLIPAIVSIIVAIIIGLLWFFIPAYLYHKKLKNNQ